MIVIMDDSHDWAPEKKEISLQELAGKPVILYRRFEQLLLDTFAGYGIQPQVFCTNDDARTTVLWANAGYGIGIVPASAFNLAAHSHLHSKILTEERLYTCITAIWMKDRYLSSLAENFLDCFQPF